jgi:hypothetical protein
VRHPLPHTRWAAVVVGPGAADATTGWTQHLELTGAGNADRAGHMVVAGRGSNT